MYPRKTQRTRIWLKCLELSLLYLRVSRAQSIHARSSSSIISSAQIKKPGLARLFYYQIDCMLDDITAFVVLCSIETFGFLLIADTQTENGIDHFKDHKRNGYGP